MGEWCCKLRCRPGHLAELQNYEVRDYRSRVPYLDANKTLAHICVISIDISEALNRRRDEFTLKFWQRTRRVNYRYWNEYRCATKRLKTSFSHAELMKKQQLPLLMTRRAPTQFYFTVATKGCGSPVSNHGRHVELILVPLKTRRVGQRCTLNLSRAETSSHWCGVVVRRGGQVSSTSLDHGSKLRGPSPKALV
ncbi:uncharacterized protein TNCV_4893021 [Trichonephila clavipes]|nr:uncharacterized protein TNCV_4893021 [Trichonephila clavipes]